MKQKAEEFILALRTILDEDLKRLQIEVVSFAMEGEQPDLSANDISKRQSKLREINAQLRMDNRNEALKIFREIPDAYLTRSQRALREKVLNGNNIADLSSFEEAVKMFEDSSSDAEIMKAVEKANWAVMEIINRESKYGPLQRKAHVLWGDFQKSVEEKVERKSLVHPIVLSKVAELTTNNADRVIGCQQESTQQIGLALQRKCFDGIRRIQEQLKEELKVLDERFKADINSLLNIPAVKNDEVTNSKEYKHFMKLCFALRDRMKSDLETEQYENNLFSDDARVKRKMVYEHMLRNMPYDRARLKEEYEKQETIIDVLEFFHKFKKFFNEIWKALLSLVDKFGLLPETTQVRNLKNSGQEWQKFVAERGSEVVKNHGLIPLNL